MRFVAIKSPEQQSILMLHRTRDLLCVYCQDYTDAAVAIGPIRTAYQTGVDYPEAKFDIGHDAPDAVVAQRKDTTEGH